MSPSELEARTRQFGREIFARIDRQGPVLFTKAWFEDQLMGLGMHDPALKVQLFRFVDTLPYLKQNRDVSRHLREYLAEAKDDFSWWVRHGMRLIPRDGLLSNVLAFAARTGARQMARKFIAGSNVAEALSAMHALRTRRLGFTIDLLGEATIAENEADHVQKQYLDLLHGLTSDVNHWPEEPIIDCDDRGPIPRVNVSVKLSALFSQFDPIDPEGTSRSVRKRLRPILSLAKQTGAFVNFDMEQHSFKDTTLRIFREILSETEYRDWPHVGIAIQAYLRDTEADLIQLRDWAKNERRCPVWVRLVKGAYWDYETVIAAQNDWPVPVWTKKWESDANFEKLSAFLLQNVDWLVPAFGSHNIRSIAHAMALAESLGVPRRRFEFQMLYGMADPIKEAIQSLGYRVRIYTPYGQLLPGMAYLVRRLLENSSNDSFLRQGFSEGLSEEVLLMNPTQVSAVRIQDSGLKAHPWQRVGAQPLQFKNDPPTNFAIEANRTAMHEALALVRTQLGTLYRPIVNNKPLAVSKMQASVNPSKHSEVLGEFALATIEDANAAVAAAQAAFPAWRDAPIEERAGLLQRVAQQFRKRRFELCAWIVLETGKPWREADATSPRPSTSAITTPSKASNCRANRSTATCPAKTTSTSTSRAASPSSSPRGTSRSPFLPA